jgi:hypothetical protein
MIEFKAWPKIPRLENEKYFITEKIDGTNACVIIDEEGNFGCQSRSRLITPEDDNYGFAKWAYENKEELLKMGPGHHYGEWWGQGVQRGYDLQEKRFSLFNTKRWNSDNPNTPVCCHVVPILEGSVEEALAELKEKGSKAAPGYMRVEGIVVYSYLAGTFYKVIIDK